MRKKSLFLAIGFLLYSFSIFSQTTIKGIVVDKETKEALVGVSVFSTQDKKGTSTELDGSFILKVSGKEAQLELTYVGYKSVKIKASANAATIELESDAVGLKDVVVTSSIGVDRRTPVAMSNIDAEVIQMKVGTREFPELLKSTPGVYATKVGGGFGDSRINIRGFESPNVAVMVNGVPMNDMEWGGVYWSNWAGLSDVTRILQVQRGLGASKVSSPSVGGSINIITKSTDAKKGGSFYYGMGNDGYNKLTFNVSTGKMSNGWAVTLLGAKTWADGYVQGAQYESYSYFLNISKLISEKHRLSLTAFGTPQWHNQRKDELLISEWAKIPENQRYRYNAGYGYDASGKLKTFNYNTYHKPQISLNHIWEINQKSSLSTALYLSLGYGGGYSGVGNNRSYAYGSTGGKVNQYYRKNDGVNTVETDGTIRKYGTFDFETLAEENAANPNGSQLAIQNAINNHIWTGLLSTYTSKITNELEFQGGIDLRYYKGIHQTKVQDLLGGAFIIDPQRVIDGVHKDDPDWYNEKLKVGDIVYRNYDGFVMQEGVFAQLEYNKNNLSVFTSGSVNANNSWRVEKFSADNEKSDVRTKLGFGIKGGANYNLTLNHNVFGNIGYFSRTPFYSGGVFLNSTKSNALNKNGKNEKVFSMELGYGYRSHYLTANVNVYRTQWKDKTMVKLIDSSNPEAGSLTLGGVNALHQGVELELKARPIENLELTAMAFIGDWKWQGTAGGYAYNANGNAVDSKGNVVEPGSADHAFTKLNIDKIHVGNSAQTGIALGGNYQLVSGVRVGLDYNFYGRNYADYDMTIQSVGKENSFTQPWRIPVSNVWDLNFSYKFKVSTMNATFNANIDNLFDAIYIADAKDGGDGKYTSAVVYYGFGRTWNCGLKVYF